MTSKASPVPLVNYVTREITCKIVYYGPGRSGKTTNLRHLHERLPADRTGQLVSLATEGDRTLFFDFLSLDLGVVAGFATRFQLYTVPGQSYYAATRRLVLQGADGVVFVADSRRRQRDENVASLQDLHEQLAEHGMDPRVVPLVFQWNKQDLPAELRESPAALDDLLNFRGAPAFAADALGGVNVFETMRAACGLVLRRLTGDTNEAAVGDPAYGAGTRTAA